MTRSILLAFTLLVMLGCDAIDDAVNDRLPDVTIGDGVLGLNGVEGAEASGTIASSGAAYKQAATATLALNRGFADYDANGGGLQLFTSKLGLAPYDDGSHFRVLRTDGFYPETIILAAGQVNLNVVVSQDGALYTIPVSAASPISIPLIRLPNLAQCDGQPCAAYSAPAGSVELVKGLFTVALNSRTDLDQLEAIVFGTCATTDCNQIDATLTLGITNDGLEDSRVFAKLGEVDTKVTPTLN